MTKRPWRFPGSKTEYFFLYAAVSLVTSVVCLAVGELSVGLVFLALVVFCSGVAWRAWTRREY